MHGRDLKAMSDFMETIYASPLRGLGEDKMCWIPSKHKGFRVSDYYKILVATLSLVFLGKVFGSKKFPLE